MKGLTNFPNGLGSFGSPLRRGIRTEFDYDDCSLSHFELRIEWLQRARNGLVGPLRRPKDGTGIGNYSKRTCSLSGLDLPAAQIHPQKLCSLPHLAVSVIRMTSHR
jgi:hypothetical protein